MRLTKFIKKCTPVSKYGWFETDLGFNVRKPLDIPMWDINAEIAPKVILKPLQSPLQSPEIKIQWFMKMFMKMFMKIRLWRDRLINKIAVK